MQSSDGWGQFACAYFSSLPTVITNDDTKKCSRSTFQKSSNILGGRRSLSQLEKSSKPLGAYGARPLRFCGFIVKYSPGASL